MVEHRLAAVSIMQTHSMWRLSQPLRPEWVDRWLRKRVGLCRAACPDRLRESCRPAVRSTRAAHRCRAAQGLRDPAQAVRVTGIELDLELGERARDPKRVHHVDLVDYHLGVCRPSSTSIPVRRAATRAEPAAPPVRWGARSRGDCRCRELQLPETQTVLDPAPERDPGADDRAGRVVVVSGKWRGKFGSGEPCPGAPRARSAPAPRALPRARIAASSGKPTA